MPVTENPESRDTYATRAAGLFVVEVVQRGALTRIPLREPPSWNDLANQLRANLDLTVLGVTYRDEDGDAITFDSNDELGQLVALQRSMGRNSVRVTVVGANAVVQSSGEIRYPPDRTVNTDDWNLIDDLDEDTPSATTEDSVRPEPVTNDLSLLDASSALPDQESTTKAEISRPDTVKMLVQELQGECMPGAERMLQMQVESAVWELEKSISQCFEAFHKRLQSLNARQEESLLSPSQEDTILSDTEDWANSAKFSRNTPKDAQRHIKREWKKDRERKAKTTKRMQKRESEQSMGRPVQLTSSASSFARSILLSVAQQVITTNEAHDCIEKVQYLNEMGFTGGKSGEDLQAAATVSDLLEAIRRLAGKTTQRQEAIDSLLQKISSTDLTSKQWRDVVSTFVTIIMKERDSLTKALTSQTSKNNTSSTSKSINSLMKSTKDFRLVLSMGMERTLEPFDRTLVFAVLTHVRELLLDTNHDVVGPLAGNYCRLLREIVPSEDLDLAKALSFLLIATPRVHQHARMLRELFDRLTAGMRGETAAMGQVISAATWFAGETAPDALEETLRFLLSLAQRFLPFWDTNKRESSRVHHIYLYRLLLIIHASWKETGGEDSDLECTFMDFQSSAWELIEREMNTGKAWNIQIADVRFDKAGSDGTVPMLGSASVLASRSHLQLARSLLIFLVEHPQDNVMVDTDPLSRLLRMITTSSSRDARIHGLQLLHFLSAKIRDHRSIAQRLLQSLESFVDCLKGGDADMQWWLMATIGCLLAGVGKEMALGKRDTVRKCWSLALHHLSHPVTIAPSLSLLRILIISDIIVDEDLQSCVEETLAAFVNVKFENDLGIAVTFVGSLIRRIGRADLQYRAPLDIQLTHLHGLFSKFTCNHITSLFQVSTVQNPWTRLSTLDVAGAASGREDCDLFGTGNDVWLAPGVIMSEEFAINWRLEEVEGLLLRIAGCHDSVIEDKKAVDKEDRRFSLDLGDAHTRGILESVDAALNDLSSEVSRSPYPSSDSKKLRELESHNESALHNFVVLTILETVVVCYTSNPELSAPRISRIAVLLERILNGFRSTVSEGVSMDKMNLLYCFEICRLRLKASANPYAGSFCYPDSRAVHRPDRKLQTLPANAKVAPALAELSRSVLDQFSTADDSPVSLGKRKRLDDDFDEGRTITNNTKAIGFGVVIEHLYPGISLGNDGVALTEVVAFSVLASIPLKDLSDTSADSSVELILRLLIPTSPERIYISLEACGALEIYNDRISIDARKKILEDFTHWFSRKDFQSNQGALALSVRAVSLLLQGADPAFLGEELSDFFMYFQHPNIRQDIHRTPLLELASFFAFTCRLGPFGKNLQEPKNPRDALSDLLLCDILIVRLKAAEFVGEVFVGEKLDQYPNIYQTLVNPFYRNGSTNYAHPLHCVNLCRIFLYLALASHVVLPEAVFHLIIAASTTSAIAAIAARCLRRLAMRYGFTTAESLFRQLKKGVLSRWVSSSRKIAEFPWRVLGYSSQRGFLQSEMQDIVAHYVLSNRLSELEETFSELAFSEAEILSQSFHVVLAYLLPCYFMTPGSLEKVTQIVQSLRDTLGTAEFDKQMTQNIDAIVQELVLTCGLPPATTRKLFLNSPQLIQLFEELVPSNQFLIDPELVGVSRPIYPLQAVLLAVEHCAKALLRYTLSNLVTFTKSDDLSPLCMRMISAILDSVKSSEEPRASIDGVVISLVQQRLFDGNRVREASGHLSLIVRGLLDSSLVGMGTWKRIRMFLEAASEFPNNATLLDDVRSRLMEEDSSEIFLGELEIAALNPAYPESALTFALRSARHAVLSSHPDVIRDAVPITRNLIKIAASSRSLSEDGRQLLGSIIASLSPHIDCRDALVLEQLANRSSSPLLIDASDPVKASWSFVLADLMDTALGTEPHVAAVAASVLRKILHTTEGSRAVHDANLDDEYDFAELFTSTRDGRTRESSLQVEDSFNVWDSASKSYQQWLVDVGKHTSGLTDDIILRSLPPVYEVNPSLVKTLLDVSVWTSLRADKMTTTRRLQNLTSQFNKIFGCAKEQLPDAVNDLLDILLFLRRQTCSNAGVREGHMILKFDYLAASTAALTSKMPPAVSLMLFEIYADQSGIYGNDLEEIEAGLRGYMMDVFKHLDRDTFDALNVGFGTQDISLKLEHDQEWLTNLAFSESMIASASQVPAQFGIAKSLRNLGLFATLNEFLRHDQVFLESTHELQSEAAWRNGQWDFNVVASPENLSRNVRIYQSLKLFCGSEASTDGVDQDYSHIMSLKAHIFEDAIRRYFTLPELLTENIVPLEAVELFDTIRDPGLTSISILRWDARRTAMSQHWEFGKGVEPVLQARTTLLRTAIRRQPNEQARIELTQSLTRHLFLATRLARKAGVMQTALNNLSVLQSNLTSESRSPADIVRIAEFAREDAKCWAAFGQRLLAIKKLRHQIAWILSLAEKGLDFTASEPSEPSLALARLYRLLGRFIGVERLERATEVIDNYLSGATALHDPANVGSFKELAGYADNHYVSSIETKLLEETSNLLSEKNEELASLKDQLRLLTNRNDPLYRSLESARRRTEMQLENDKAEVARLMEERENDDLTTNEAVASHIGSVPSWKFVELVHQLSAHLGRSTGTEGNNLFQEVLYNLLERLAMEHPHHTLPIIFALRNSSSVDPTTAASNRSRREAGTGRSYEAQMILDQIRGSSPDGTKRIVELDAVLSGYIELADKKISKDTHRKTLPLQGMRLMSLKDLSYCALVTKDFPLDPSGGYEDVVTVQRFKSEATLVGGITVPKKVVDRLLKRNNTTRARGLSIRTYKVLPLTQNSGILEWVNNTRPIGDCMLELHAKYNAGDMPPIEARKRMQEEHARKGASTESKTKVFDGILAKFRPAFKYFFMERWWKPQEWFDHRQSYIKSCATMSIVGWLMGLGDRHTQNILLDTSTAELIHIDFGIAFEFGKLLSTPELVPFRLTQDMVDGMGVTGVEGTFRKTCEEVLRLLRSEAASYMLVTVLDVFRYDPLQRWTIAKSKARRVRNLDDNDGGAEYNSPSASTSRRGAHAVTATSTGSSLSRSQSGTESNKEAERCLTVVKSKLANHVSVHCTVNELVQTATSRELLALMFPGWQPFVSVNSSITPSNPLAKLSAFASSSNALSVGSLIRDWHQVKSAGPFANQARTKYHKARVVMKRHCPHCVVTTRKQYALVVCRAHPEHNQRATLQPMRARRWPAQSWTDRHAKSVADDYAKDFEALAARKLALLEWQNRVETEKRAEIAARLSGNLRIPGVNDVEQSQSGTEIEGTWISDTVADIPPAEPVDEVPTSRRPLIAGRVPAVLVRYQSTKWRVEPPWKRGVRKVEIARHQRRVKRKEEEVKKKDGFLLQGGRFSKVGLGFAKTALFDDHSSRDLRFAIPAHPRSLPPLRSSQRSRSILNVTTQLPSISSTVTAAAFQDHFMIAAGLKKRKRKVVAKPIPVAASTASRSLRTKADPCARYLPENGIERVLNPIVTAPTLAERLSLVERGGTLEVTDVTWDAAKARCVERRDHLGTCPICQEEWGMRGQVVLSCSHLFHQACLSSYERHVSAPRCPLCRMENYTARIVHLSSHVNLHKSATLVQSIWRGYLARRAYLIHRAHNAPRHPILLRKWLDERALCESRRLREKVETERQGLMKFLAKVDEDVQKSRKEIWESIEAMEDVFAVGGTTTKPQPPPTSNVQPTRPVSSSEVTLPSGHRTSVLLSTALQRTSACSECAICLTPLQLAAAIKSEYSSLLQRKVKPLVVLDPCAHAYHKRCVESLERYCGEAGKRCPMCRAEYKDVVTI
ncbi:hypothetical protein HDU93_008237 [Gonapodya sp. JEL0774]|nr:hypothetical protein HDU93_008237 [Gonapodya sp. JEL0774]